MQLDISLFILINGLAGKFPIFDNFMILSANLPLIIPFYLLYLWFKDNYHKHLSLFIFTSVLFSLLISVTISSIYYRPRPFAINLGKKLIPHEADSSFPSDSATAVFAVAFSLLLFRKYKVGTIWFLLSLLVGFARIFCGVHFPSDILGGAIISLFVSFVIYASRGYLNVLFDQIIFSYDRLVKKIR